ncbi:MAG: T9SS type A sorting domain-containing protein [Bacteroidetes bacterium]|nr:T9SS type A sorting domain-containing protein [Bacteroidota bacterium]
MRELYKSCTALLCLALFIQIPSLLFAQAKRTLTAYPNTAIDAYINGFYVSLPASYATGSRSYPLLIFLHGIGEVGDGSPSQLPAVLRNGPPMQINQQVNNNVDAHFPDPVVVNGNSYEFIVIAPQLSTQPDQNGPEQAMVDDIINYASSHWRVDATKISLTGLSMGGGIGIEYPGQSASLYGDKLASFLGVAVASYNATDRTKEIAAAHLPVWLTVNSGDPTGPYSYTVGYIDQLNTLNATPAPVETIFNASGHGGWVDTYGAPTDGGGAHPGITNSNGLNVYQWMAQYKRVGNTVQVDAGTTPLPVTWGVYDARLNRGAVTVSWSTVQEQNNRFFIIQRSADGKYFANLDTTAAANAPHAYSYVDKAPLPTTGYYRVMQVDLDGRTGYSGIMSVNSSAAQPLSLKPNPTAGILYLEMVNADQGRLELTLVDASGRTLRKWTFDKQTLYWSQAINTDGLPAGTYHLTVRGSNTRTTRTFVKTGE